tara:strand:- start:3300 stop:3467 length:168 start_codon:yes stop_codon:yes gene_type:complete
MLEDFADMGKVLGAGTVGVGNWYIELSQILQISISATMLVYIIGKTYFMFKKNKD